MKVFYLDMYKQLKPSGSPGATGGKPVFSAGLTSNNINHEITNTAVASMLNLGNIFQLVINSFYKRAFS